MKYASHGDVRDAVCTVDISKESCDTSRRRVKFDVLVVVKNVGINARGGVTESGICILGAVWGGLTALVGPFSWVGSRFVSLVVFLARFAGLLAGQTAS